MKNISFTSTYRIPITQAGATPAKKEQLRELVQLYPNKLVSKGNTGTVRISIPDSEDAKFVKSLKDIGYKVFQIFEGENISRGKLPEYIKTKLLLGEYEQVGKQKKRLSAPAKQKRAAAIAKNEREEVLKKLKEAEERARIEAIEEKKLNKEINEKFDQYAKMHEEAMLRLKIEADKSLEEKLYSTDLDFDFEEFEIK